MSKNECIVFDASESKRHIDDNGYLHVDASNITKEQVADYYGSEIPDFENLGLTGDKIYKMYRPAAELEKAAGTFNGIPLALDHHMMSAESMPKEHIVGSLGTEARFEAPYLINALIVTDKKAIDAIEAGEYRQLSAAYRYVPVMESGTFNGVHYDGRMTDISGNHVALVREGRAGPDVVVADSKPTKISNRSVDNMTVKNVSGIVQRAIALDAVPEIEHAEVNGAALLQAINVIEAQREGIDPHSIGLDFDSDASVDDIVERLFKGADESNIETIKALLEKLKGAEAKDAEPDTPEQAADEEGEEIDYSAMGESVKEEPKEDAEAVEPEQATDEETKAAMKECGLDADNEGIVKAFEAGMAHAKKAEDEEAPEQVEDEETKTADDPTGKENAAPIEEQVKKAVEDAKLATVKHMRKMAKAAEDCAPLAGRLDPFAFDSAEDIFKKTLELNGIKANKYPRSAWCGMVDMLKMQNGRKGCAMDSARVIRESSNVEASLKGLDNIVIM